MIFLGKHNEQYTTGRELGKGGEGSVYELQNHRELVLKQYNEPLTSNKLEKLELMVAMRSSAIDAYAAWPVDIVRDETGLACGFVMKKLMGYVPLHHVFSPMDRKRMFPDKGYNFLVHVARNIATAFHKLHEAGLVVGDVNEGNILISSSGLAAFIDCDSFQVRGADNYFFCEVGVPRYTPPELLKKQSFEQVVRTANTDGFSLAVLIFQLLFLGRHPFAGKHRGAADIDEETAIRQKQFAYSLENTKKKLSPPPDSFSITNLPDPIVQLFHRAFEQDERPQPADWVKALDGLLADMATCSISKIHSYPAMIAECPWCKYRKDRGIMYFLDDSYFEAQNLLGNIEAFINGFQPPKLVLNKPNLNIPVMVPGPSGIGKNFIAANNARKWASFLLIAIGLFLIAIENWWCLFFFVAAFLTYKHSHWARILNKEHTRLASKCSALHTRLKAMLIEFENTVDIAAYNRVMRTLQNLIYDYKRLPDELEKRKKIMEEALYSEQLDDYLWQFNIDDHTIPGIGAAKKSALYNNGIRNAAHLAKLPGTKVPGIGPTYEQVLMNWRRQMASGFVYIPDNYKLNIGLQKAKDDVSQIKLQLESKIRREYQSLNFLKVNIQNRAVILERQIQDMRIQVRQAEVDAHSFNKFR